MVKSFPYIEVNGTNYQVGCAIGEHLREKIQDYNDHIKVLYYKHVRDWDELKVISKRVEKLISKHFPKYLKEIKGMAKGSNIPLEDMLLLCDEETILETVKNKCTTIAYSCKDGIFLGHNEDWIPGYEDHLYIVKGTVKKGASFLSLAYIGSLPGSSVALNSHGVAFSGNSLLSGAHKGMPKNVILRSQVEAKTLKEFERLASFSPRAISNHTMAVDKKGGIVSVELALDKHCAVYTNGCFVHTNHPVHKKMEGLEPGSTKNSVIRYNTTIEYTLSGDLNKNLVADILRSHKNNLDSICVHAKKGDKSKGQTVASVIVDVGEMTMSVAYGNPCKSKYKAYRF